MVMTCHKGNFFNEGPDTKLISDEVQPQGLQGLRTVGSGVLFGEVAEKLSDECPMRGRAPHGIAGEVTCSVEGFGVASFGRVLALGLYELVMLGVTPSPDRIKVLEGEPQGVDD